MRKLFLRICYLTLVIFLVLSCNQENPQSNLKEQQKLSIDDIIQKDLEGLSQEDLSKILGPVHRSVTRHTNGNREYIEFIHKFVEMRVGKGIRVVPRFGQE